MINVWASVTAYDIAHIPAHMAVEEVAIIAHERLHDRKLLFPAPPTAMTPTTPAAASSTSLGPSRAPAVDDAHGAIDLAHPRSPVLDSL